MMRTINKIALVISLVCLAWVSQVSAQCAKQSLNSSGNISWQVMPQADVADGGRQVSMPGYQMKNAVKGVVPGVVFTAYVEAGKEKDPNFADNIYQVDEKFYNRPFWYRTEFVLDQTIERGQHVWLNFDNTNRFADFFFNGTKISGTEESTKDVSGHMIRSRFDVTKLIKTKGKNALAVLIYDADQKKTRDDKDPYGVACSPSYLAAAGWDWMPYVPGRLSGITGNAYLTVTGDAVMRDPWVRSQLPSIDRAELQLSSDVDNITDTDLTITLRGTIMPGNISFSKDATVKAHASALVRIDTNDVKNFVIMNPRLWYPNGYGEPALYTCHMECVVNGKVTDRHTIDFGIRKYEYRMEQDAMGYPVLNLYVNGQRIFVKGGNWGMSEYLLRCHGEEYEPKIRLHKEMNYNMIRLWTGCVTDDEFYDYCDRYGIMVWDDFWLYVAFNDVVQHDAFKDNARDKVRRLRNHPCIAMWCGANETHPAPDIDNALRMIVMQEDGNDRMYQSCSNQDALSGSGWWKDMPPSHHFETSGSNLAFNKPAYPYGIDYGYGFRTEIGMATFPTYESVKLFIPRKELKALPSDDELKNDDKNVWNRHFFGKEASNADPVGYRQSVNQRYGVSSTVEEFCEKAQLINLEDMKGMYEAWNDKMWNDASGLMIWMSHPAYPSFVWQTYDYYYDPTGCYWGAKQGCEPLHVQWNCLNNSVKVINTTSHKLIDARVEATVYDLNGRVIETLNRHKNVSCEASNKVEAFVMNFDEGPKGMQFIRLKLKDSTGKLLSENFYWHNADKELDYTDLNTLPEALLNITLIARSSDKITLKVTNTANTVAFANRLRLVNRKTGERILPAIMNDNYFTLMPGEEKNITVEANHTLLNDGFKVLLKQYRKSEKNMLTIQ